MHLLKVPDQLPSTNFNCHTIISKGVALVMDGWIARWQTLEISGTPPMDVL